MNIESAQSVRTLTRLLAGAGAACLLLACASDPSRNAERESSARGINSTCMINRAIRDYNVLDSRNLILFGPGTEAHHIVLATPSVNVEREIRIGVQDDGDGRICPGGRDAILVDGVIPERIQIRSIESLEPADVEALKVEYGLEEGADDAVTVTEIEVE
jgi:hypothetical protein